MARSDAVSALCAGILEGRSARKAFRRELRERYISLAGECLSGRKAALGVRRDRHVDVRRLLAEHRARRTKEASALARELRESSAQRKRSAREFLSGCGRIRAKASLEMGRGLREHRLRLNGAVLALLGECSQDRRRAMECWRKVWGLSEISCRAAREEGTVREVSAEEPDVTVGVVSEEEGASLRERVLDVVRSNPQGITLVDMQAMMGVPRIRLGAVARDLVEKGLVKKEDRFYYPVPDAQVQEGGGYEP